MSSIASEAPVGLVAAATGGLALLVLGPLLLPDRRDQADPGYEGEATFLTELRPRDGYGGLGRPIGQIDDLNRREVVVVGIRTRSSIKREGVNEHVPRSDRIVARVRKAPLALLAPADRRGDAEGRQRGVKGNKQRKDREAKKPKKEKPKAVATAAFANTSKAPTLGSKKTK